MKAGIFIAFAACAFFCCGLCAQQEVPRKIAVSSYAWKNSTLERMFEDLGAAGVKDVAVFQNAVLSAENPLKFSPGLDEGGRAAFRELFKKHGVNIVAYCHVRMAKEDEVEELFKFLREFDVLHVTVEAPAQSLPLYEKFSEKYGTRPGLYNHAANSSIAVYPTPEGMLEALKGFARVGAFPDCGHWERSGFDIVECAKKLEGKMLGISLQDVEADLKDCAAFGTGVCNLEGLLDELARQKFSGWHLVMFTAKDEPMKYIQPCLDFLKQRPLLKDESGACYVSRKN